MVSKLFPILLFFLSFSKFQCDFTRFQSDVCCNYWIFMKCWRWKDSGWRRERERACGWERHAVHQPLICSIFYRRKSCNFLAEADGLRSAFWTTCSRYRLMYRWKRSILYPLSKLVFLKPCFYWSFVLFSLSLPVFVLCSLQCYTWPLNDG